MSENVQLNKIALLIKRPISIQEFVFELIFLVQIFVLEKVLKLVLRTVLV